VTVPNIRPLADPTTGRPLRSRLGTAWPAVRPSEAEPPALDEPPFDPTELAVPEDPLDEPLELGAGRSVAAPEDDDPGGAVRPWALASWGTPSPTATSSAINV
jgi:hypothetical protein